MTCGAVPDVYVISSQVVALVNVRMFEHAGHMRVPPMASLPPRNINVAPGVRKAAPRRCERREHGGAAGAEPWS